MKNLLLIPACCLVAMLLLFTSCEKDEFIDSEQLVTQADMPEQLSRRNCGMATRHQGLMKDPTYQKMHQEKLDKVLNMPAPKVNCTTPVILPLAFHFQGTRNADINCLRQMAQEQVDILNADFQGTNSDITRWRNEASPSFPGISNGEACFQFCLADKNHPSGFGLSDGDPAITVNATNGESDNRWSGYINIFIQPNTGLLGSAPFGGEGNGDGISIDAAAFGTGSACGNVQAQAPFTLGRTLTHEMGHYLFLDHIWGGQESCSGNDQVADTPNSAGPYDGCPSIGASSCNSTDLHMNYMDYSNDACMYMFTSGQITRSTNYLNASLRAVAANASRVCQGGGNGGGGQTPSCNDGVRNGNETGVDCGGPDCSPCTPQPAGCFLPTQTTSSEVTDTEARLSWSAAAGQETFRVIYRRRGTTPWTKRDVTGTSYSISNLNPEVRYEWRVRSICTDEVSRYTRSSFFTTTATTSGGNGNDGECQENKVTLIIRLDDYGSETTWELLNDNGNVVSSGGPYEDNREGDLKVNDFCLTDGCYTVVIYDDAGDGLCCGYGRGRFWLRDANGSNIYSGRGRFGNYVEVDFCVTNDGTGQSVLSNVLAKPQDIKPEKVAAAAARKGK